jgi:uncharacterized protein YerC
MKARRGEVKSLELRIFHLCNALTQIKDPHEGRSFLEDLLASDELNQISMRWSVLLHLKQVEMGLRKKETRLEIAEDEGCAREVVTRTAKHLPEKAGPHTTGVASLVARRVLENNSKEEDG